MILFWNSSTGISANGGDGLSQVFMWYPAAVSGGGATFFLDTRILIPNIAMTSDGTLVHIGRC